MLVTNCVVTHRFQHRRQITHLEVPDAVLVQDRRHIFHESERVFQVVEHCNRGDDARLANSKSAPKEFGRKEIQNYGNVFLIKRSELFCRRVDSNNGGAIFWIKGKQSTVVTSDIQDEV